MVAASPAWRPCARGGGAVVCSVSGFVVGCLHGWLVGWLHGWLVAWSCMLLLTVA